MDTVTIPVELEAGRAREFLDRLGLQLVEGSWRGGGSFRADGEYEERITGRFAGAADARLTLCALWRPDGTLAPLAASVEGNAPGGWESTVRRRVDGALAATMDPGRERYSFNVTYAYMGPPLSGRYHIGDFHLAPAVHPPDDVLWSERVVQLGVRAEGTDRRQALQLARIRGERLASLLSCFLNVGLYAVPARRVNLLTGHERMSSRDAVCPPGEFESVDRSKLLLGGWETRLRLPGDISSLLGACDRLPPPHREAFITAAALYRTALTAGQAYPAVRMAYAVAAVDALGRGRDGTSFESFVLRFCPEAPPETVRYGYEQVRSSHLDGGGLAEGGPTGCVPGTGPDQLPRTGVEWEVQAIMWCVLLRWLLSNASTGYTAD